MVFFYGMFGSIIKYNYFLRRSIDMIYQEKRHRGLYILLGMLMVLCMAIAFGSTKVMASQAENTETTTES